MDQEQSLEKTFIVDPWVTRYEDLKTYMINIGIPSEKTGDYDWIKQHINSYCDSTTVIAILKQLKELHGY